jgi:mannose-6-phosphate isomerase-like protein (cupin superfamily)
MEAHDLRAALNGLPTLTITSSTTAEEADAAVREFGSFNQCTLSLMRYSGQPPWERHPNGDELLHVLEGEMDVTVLGDKGPIRVLVRVGAIFVVPRGLWHRPVAESGVTLFSATPRPTEVSFAPDPRHESQAK